VYAGYSCKSLAVFAYTAFVLSSHMPREGQAVAEARPGQLQTGAQQVGNAVYCNAYNVYVTQQQLLAFMHVVV
jgi:hypothetical protein